VEIQAQGDEMTLDALKDIRISSSEETGHQREAGNHSDERGGYIRIGRSGSVRRRTKSGRAAGSRAGSTDFAITPEVRRLSDDSPVAGLKLGLAGGDGSQQKLATSASGATAVQNNVNIDSLNASYLDDN
jgi:type VI secretion system secreted protein VgrG